MYDRIADRVRLRIRAAHFHRPAGGRHRSMQQIADSSGLSIRIIQRLERGEPSRLLLSQLLPVATALGVRLAALVSQADPGPVDAWASTSAPTLEELSAHLRSTLRRRMAETGLGAPRLAAKAGVARSSVSRYRSGVYEVSLEIFDQLATALGDDIGDWLVMPPSPSPSPSPTS